VEFISEIRSRAAGIRPRLAFPEAFDPRVQAAVSVLQHKQIAQPVLIIDPEHLTDLDPELRGSCEVIVPESDPRLQRVAADLYDARKAKGMSEEQARHLARVPLFFADDLVRHGDVAACVSGCATTTADVLRAALWLVGPAAGVTTVSSAFYMVVHPFRGPSEEVLTFTDCAVVPYPSASQLADIALSAARDRRRIVGDEPVVAFLSFSSRGSAEGESVTRVREAMALFKARGGSVRADGELQADAALITSVGQRKAPGSIAAGSANVLVFPSLDAGNIAYKLVERLSGAAAIGPILQGLAKPCSDLSRGASPDDIINTAAITALQTQDAVV
jgi:phosphate acetyltransferase